MSESQEPVKGTYQHYKGGFYEVLGIADDPTREGRFVVYQSLGIAEDLTGEHEQRVLRTGNKGALSICSVERFTELVDGGPYAGGARVPRFKLIARMPGG
jgi:hypothetical protein